MEYSIKEIAKQTGINAFTIRIWEKRYNLTTPRRTNTNIRIYSQDDFHKILAVATLVRRGFKISEIATLSTEQLSEKLKTLETMNDDTESKVTSLLAAADKFDEQLFEKILNRQILYFGFENTFLDTILPMAEVLEEKWILSPIYQSIKQFAYDIIRRKIIVASDNQPSNISNHKFLIFSTRTDDCELFLLFTAYIIKKYRFQVVYAGENISIETAQRTAQAANCNYVVMIDKIIENPEDISQKVALYAQSFKGINKYLISNYCKTDGYNISVFVSLKLFAEHIATLSKN